MTDPRTQALREAADLVDRGVEMNIDSMGVLQRRPVTKEDILALIDKASEPAPVVKVKLLEWENFDAWTWWAKTPIGVYRVQERESHWAATFSWEGHHKQNSIAVNEGGEEAAKAAAQADYESRILSALTTAPMSTAEAAEPFRPIASAPQTGEQILVALRVYGSDSHSTHAKRYLRTEYAIAEAGEDGPYVDYDTGWNSMDWTHWAPLRALAAEEEKE